MGSVERCDITLPLNDMIYYVRKDAVLRDRWLNDLENLCREFGCSAAEYEALRDVDVKRLMEIGVHQYLIPHILRLFYGVTGMTNNHPALTAYQNAFPKESQNALSGTIWDREKETS
ncbi:MAG: hypothetical protein O3A84_11460 [Proteobacteria bacterium]|nr:hypothetical protein [Pseudomonadota bacterium]